MRPQKLLTHAVCKWRASLHLSSWFAILLYNTWYMNGWWNASSVHVIHWKETEPVHCRSLSLVLLQKLEQHCSLTRCLLWSQECRSVPCWLNSIIKSCTSSLLEKEVGTLLFRNIFIAYCIACSYTGRSIFEWLRSFNHCSWICLGLVHYYS